MAAGQKGHECVAKAVVNMLIINNYNKYDSAFTQPPPPNIYCAIKIKQQKIAAPCPVGLTVYTSTWKTQQVSTPVYIYAGMNPTDLL